MVYAYDQWAPLPTKDLYNTQLMLASINAAKDMYDKAEADVKEFNTKYGEFYKLFKQNKDLSRSYSFDMSNALGNKLDACFRGHDLNNQAMLAEAYSRNLAQIFKRASKNFAKW